MIENGMSLESFSLKDLIEISALRGLLESFTRLTAIPTAIIDVDGTVLVGSGWQEICTEFHRKHPITAARCLESDTVLANRPTEDHKCHVYKCRNGLVDVAVPIVIENLHLGNIFTGQFFLEPPDLDFFTRQAEEFDFDKGRYLKSLQDVPIFSAEKVEQAMAFLSDLTIIIGSAGLARKRLYRLNADLEERIVERTAAIHAEKIFSDSLINSLPGIMYTFDRQGRFRRWNINFEVVTGYSAEQIQKLHPLDLFATTLQKRRIAQAIGKVFLTGSATIEADFTTSGGQQIPYLFTGYAFTQNDVQYLVGIGLDISDRVRTEKEKEVLIGRLHETLSKVKQLSGLLPICASCKNIRDDEGYWKQIEAYLSEHSEVEFSHSICPDCFKKLYPGLKI